MKIEVFQNYGGAFCRCCGEDFLGFLCVDHIWGTGWRETLRGTNFYRKLKREGWPRQDELQILCHNCNSNKAQNANVCNCPYQKRKRKR